MTGSRTLLCLLSVLGGVAVLGCSQGDAPSDPSETGGAQATRTFELSDVVHTRIAELEREFAQELDSSGDAAGDAAPEDPDLVERLRGLASETPGAQPRWKTIYREEVAGIGDAAIEPLAVLAEDETLSDTGRIGALELLAAVDSPLAARALLTLTESQVDWIRRHAVYQLGEMTQSWVVPALVRRLFYETDGEAVVWLARSLAHKGNFAGLDGLFTLERTGSDTVRALASQEVARQVEATGAGDAAALREAWNTSGHELIPRSAPSTRQRLAVWKMILEISGERFQLRGVDEARFVLARSEEWVATLLAEALHDRDTWTRVHAAQCLDRMGGRARNAEQELIAGLDDPGLAPAAAEALGGVGGPPAAAALSERLASGRDHELRVAAARGLGRLDEDGVVDALKGVLGEEEPLDLRQTAARSLAMLGEGAEVATFLVECLGSVEADAHGAELALEIWLRGEAEEENEVAAEVLAAWEAAAGEKARSDVVTPSIEEVRRRQGERRTLLMEALDRLVR
jgi:HEAT repeat protein